ncbi:hypothetical protein [Pseudomonas sp. R37(2017)]|uniref:hypothetical protein n=1 Tax=Pseudomonas sp. R37(2017) TaxID=1981685 RepID=UPI000A1DA584|nr:hypothetical protein [Pseudomonas sp. R37(2017)]
MTQTAEELSLRWHNQLFGIRRSIRYHLRRRAFFERLDQLSNMFSVIFGSTAVYGILDTNAKVLALASSAVVTVLASINLVVGSAQRARAHSDFVRQYVELEKRMLVPPTEDCLLAIMTDRLSIEAGEPPVLHVLNSICHNELMRSMGYKKEELVKIGLAQRLLAHFVDFRGDAIH